MNVLDALARLVVAAALSGVVGFERETARKAAGLRTHMLVGLGAALFGLLSLQGFRAPDPSRIAAQVVTGIGFLGAGAIFREGQLVRGLTTAAGLWTVAAIGLAAGAGLYGVSAAATVVTLMVLYGVKWVDHMVERRTAARLVTFEVDLSDLTHLGEVLQIAAQITEEPIEHVEYLAGEDGGAVIRFKVASDRADTLVALLTQVDGVDTAQIPE